MLSILPFKSVGKCLFFTFYNFNSKVSILMASFKIMDTDYRGNFKVKLETKQMNVVHNNLHFLRIVFSILFFK